MAGRSRYPWALDPENRPPMRLTVLTLSLALVTITIAVAVAVPLGVIAAWRFGGWLDRALMGFSVLGFSIPIFVLAYLRIWLVSLKLGWLPVQGYKRLAEGLGPWLYHLALPALTLSVI